MGQSVMSDAVMRAMTDLLDDYAKKRRAHYYPTSQIHDEVVIGDPMETETGLVYLHKERKRPVRILGGRDQLWTGGGYIYLYPAEDILTGDRIHVARADLSLHSLNEMEVLAWAAK